jgi:hypothetical protein
MLMPNKHISFSESLLGFGSYVIGKLGGSPKSVDFLWSTYQSDVEASRYAAKLSFDALLLTIVFLYSVGVVEEKEGALGLCN